MNCQIRGDIRDEACQRTLDIELVGRRDLGDVKAEDRSPLPERLIEYPGWKIPRAWAPPGHTHDGLGPRLEDVTRSQHPAQAGGQGALSVELGEMASELVPNLHDRHCAVGWYLDLGRIEEHAPVLEEGEELGGMLAVRRRRGSDTNRESGAGRDGDPKTRQPPGYLTESEAGHRPQYCSPSRLPLGE